MTESAACVGTEFCDTQAMKGNQKPKKTAKKPAQKSLKERRNEKRAAAKLHRTLDV